MAAEIRAATEADIEAFFPDDPPALSMRAMVAIEGGRPVAIGGIAYQGSGRPPYLFSAVKPGCRRKTIVMSGRAMLRALAKPGMPAAADPEHPGAPHFLARLGFDYAGLSGAGDMIFIYRGTP